LINLTLTTMPLFFMSTFRLPAWVVKKIDKKRRHFLWHGHKDNTTDKYMSLVSWEMVIKTKHMGGLGIKDLNIMNQALLTKIMWNWVQKETWGIHSLYDRDKTMRLWLHA
jgi:hypothetical protein